MGGISRLSPPVPDGKWTIMDNIENGDADRTLERCEEQDRVCIGWKLLVHRLAGMDRGGRGSSG